MSALSWRWKVIVMRNKFSLCRATCLAIAASIAWVIVYFMGMGSIQPQSFSSLSYINIANPSMDWDKANFCREPGTVNMYDCQDGEDLNQGNMFTQVQLFENCTSFGATDIGLIYASENDEKITNAVLANEILDEVFTSISESYYKNNEKAGKYEAKYFGRQVFSSDKELNRHVLAPDYASNQICFAMTWIEFNEETDTYNMDLRYVLNTQIPSTDITEDLNGKGFFIKSFANQYFNIGFMNVMSVVADRLAAKKYDTELQFEMMYTSMDTGTFTDNSLEVAGAILAISIYMSLFQASASNLVSISNEENEDKVQWILKRNGMREVVEVVRQTVFYCGASSFLIILQVIEM